jgi:hypothetical protein
MNTPQLDNLQSTALALFNVSKGIFWEFLPIVFLLAILTIYISGEMSGQSFEKLFKRLVIAILLLVAFPKISDAIVGVENYLVKSFGGDETLSMVFSRIADHAKEVKIAGTSSWYKFGQFGLTLIATLSFLILSVVHHFLDVLHLTTWNLLHILGPLALLGSLFPSFSQIPKGIFMGLFELSLWRPVWVIMCRILIAIGFGDSPPDPSQWFDTAVMNFAVAGLIASTPSIVRGLLSGSLASIGGGTLQTMIGGAGAFLSQMPGRALQSVTGRAAKTLGLSAPSIFAKGGSKGQSSRPQVSRTRKFISKDVPKSFVKKPSSKE